MRPITLMLLVTGCGTVSSPQVDAGVDVDARVDAQVDAGFDAPPVAPGEWGFPEYVLNINSAVDETTPSASADNRTLYFSRLHAKSFANYDIFMSTRTGTDPHALWGLPIPVDTLVDVSSEEQSPEPTANGRELYLEGVARGRVFLCTRNATSDPWGTPRFAWVEGGHSPALAADGLTIYYSSGAGPWINLRSRVSLTGPWGPEQSAGIPGNPTYHEVSVSADDLHMVLSDPATTAIPAIVELSRASTADPWDNLTEIRSLTSLPNPPRDCDFFADADTMYCSMTDGTDYDIYVVRRMPK